MFNRAMPLALIAAVSSFGLVAQASVNEPRASQPQSEFQVTDVGLKADAHENLGPCPITVGFGGWVRTNGPGTVRYKFIRSDGAEAPEETLTFEQAGLKQVRTTWTLGRAYKGWQSIKIVSPNEVESNRAEFLVKCDSPPAEFRVTEVGLKADRYDYKQPCPVTVGFTGHIRVSAPGTVTYCFIRSDGATSEPATLTFDKPSYATVKTSWTLGSADFPTEERWVAIRILSPTEAESNRARFLVICDRPPVEATR